MQTNFEYISFKEVAYPSNTKRKTSHWICRANRSGIKLGEVRWYPAWRQYCFFVAPNSVFSLGCLTDIQKFIAELTEERRCWKTLAKLTTY